MYRHPEVAWTWFAAQSGTFSPAGETLAHPPPNQKDTSNDNGSPWTSVTGACARDLYIQWIVKRKDNMGASLIAPPRYTYSFLVNNSIIGATRLATIGNLLDWISANCVHYFGTRLIANPSKSWRLPGSTSKASSTPVVPL
jgi:hypothetical protein